MKQYRILPFVGRRPEIQLVCEYSDIWDLCSQQFPPSQNKSLQMLRWCKEFKLLQIGWAMVTLWMNPETGRQGRLKRGIEKER